MQAEALKKAKKEDGRPPNMWITLIEEDVKLLSNIQLKIELNSAEEKHFKVLEKNSKSANRKNWRRIIKDIVAENR